MSVFSPRTNSPRIQLGSLKEKRLTLSCIFCRSSRWCLWACRIFLKPEGNNQRREHESRRKCEKCQREKFSTGNGFAGALLTASRRPDSVGELSMSASNTSSVPVLTYIRTSEEAQGKRRFTKEFSAWSTKSLQMCISACSHFFAGLPGGSACSEESNSALGPGTSSSWNSWKDKGSR